MARRASVWIVTPELHRHGGTELSLAEEVERWRERFDIRLYTMRIHDVDLAGVAVRRIPWLPGPLLFRYIWWILLNKALRIWDSRRKGAPDVVLSPGVNCLDADVIGVHVVFAKLWEEARAATVGDLKRPQTFARAVHRILYWKFMRRLERTLYSGSAQLWALSNAGARDIERRFGKDAGSVSVIPYGVDAARFSPEQRARLRDEARRDLGLGSSRVALIIGNDVFGKGIDTAVESLASLPHDVVLAVAGDADRLLLTDRARELGVDSRVKYLPHVRFVMRYYAAADLLIAPSRIDEFGLPPLEAMAAGIPVVVSGRAGVAELIDDGRHGLILKDPEDAAELGLLVQRILDDSSLSASLVTEARALAESDSWDRNAERAEELILRSLGLPGRVV